MAENKKVSKKSTSTKSTTKKTVAKTATKKVPEKKEVKKVETPIKKEVKTTKKTVKKVETPKKEVKTVQEPVKKVETVVAKKETKTFSNFVKKNVTNIILGLVCILLIANIILVVLGHKVKLANGEEILASVEGKEYTAEQLFDSLKNKYGKDTLINLIDEFISSKELTEEDLTNAKKDAQGYIDGIKTQYESAGYKWEDVLTQYGYDSEDALLNEYLVSVKSEYVVKNYIGKNLTDDEIKKYYDENIYGTYTVKHILIKPDTTDDMSDEEKTAKEEEAKATAQEVISKYAAGENWASLVTTYSEDDGSKDSEGLIENFTKGDVVDEFFNAAIALKDNEYTIEPVKSNYGYHVILKVSSTDKESLEKSKDKVVSALIDEKLNSDSNLYSNTWVKIRNDYKLSINDTNIKSSYEKSISE